MNVSFHNVQKISVTHFRGTTSLGTRCHWSEITAVSSVLGQDVTQDSTVIFHHETDEMLDVFMLQFPGPVREVAR